MKYLLFSILLMSLVGCAKKDMPPTIPANTLRLTVKGDQVTFPANSATLTISEKGTKWNLKAQSSIATMDYIKIEAYSATAALESPGVYSQIADIYGNYTV